MKLKLFQWLSTSLVLLAATRPVTAGDWCPYTAQGVTSTYTSYFELNHCPFPACGSEHVRSSHFLGHLGEILPNATYIQVDQPEVTFNGSTFSGDLLISFGTRYWEFSMHQQGVKQWSNFRPTQFKVEWTVYAGQGTLAQVTGGKVPVWTKSGSESYPAVSSLGSGAGNKCTIIWDGSCNVNRSYKVPLDEIARKLKISSTNTEPVYFYVSFTVTPDGWVENGYKIEEGGYSCNVRNYLRPHTVTSSWSSTVAQSACKLRFRYHVSQFSFNTYEGNAILNTGNGEHAVVYNDPRSEISFVVTVGQGNNLPISKIVNSKRATPAVFMVTGTQPALWSQDPHSNIQTYKSWPDGMADAWSCDYNMGSASPSSLIRKRNVVLNTNGAVLVDSIGKPLPISQRYNPALITIDATQDGRSLQLDRCLKDFSYTGNAIKDGSIFYVGMKALYSTTSSSLYKEPYLMSYVNGGSVSPGVAISLGSIYSIADYESVPSSNVVSFEVLPAVSFPPLPLSEVEEHKVCETEGFSLETEADYIHLRGRRIVSPKYSETLYQPLYGWQFSYDKKVWNNVEESECGFSPSSLPYTINYNNELDALVHGSILRKRERVYFRQYCVLKSFYSKHRKEGFYDYKVDCGDETRYYLQVYDEQVITYAHVPSTMSMANFSWLENPTENTDNQRVICTSEAGANVLEQYPVAFQLQGDKNLNGEDLEQVKAVASYSIRDITDSTSTFLINSNQGYINYHGWPVVYRCAIHVCNREYAQDLRFVPSPFPIISILGTPHAQEGVVTVGDVTLQDAFLASRDTLNKVQTLYLTTVRGKDVKLTLGNNDGTQGAVFEYRAEVPWTEPDTIDCDFSLLTSGEMEQFADSMGWNIGRDMPGLTFSDGPIDILRMYMNGKRLATNEQIRERARQAYADANAWKTVQTIQGVDRVSLRAYSDTVEMIEFYLRKSNSDGCTGDSLRVEIMYAHPLENNYIRLEHEDERCAFLTIYEDKNPVIVGSLPGGGFGAPDETGDNIYRFTWLYYDHNESYKGWQPFDDYGFGSVDVSRPADFHTGLPGITLPAGLIACMGTKSVEVRRVVTSYRHGQVGALISDTSNVMVLYPTALIDAQDFVYPEAVCNDNLFRITYRGMSNMNGEVYVECDDPDVQILEESANNYALIKGAYHNFEVRACLQTMSNGRLVKTNTVSFEVRVDAVRADFDLLYDGNLRNCLEPVQLRPGQRIRLINRSESDDVLQNVLWTMDTTPYNPLSPTETNWSECENPACYLYNPGVTRICLRAATASGCQSKACADLEVVGTGSIRKSAVFETDESTVELPAPLADNRLRVYPTEVEQSCWIETSRQQYRLCVSDMNGRKWMEQGPLDGLYKLDMSAFPAGWYLLQIDGETFKIWKK